MSILLCLFKSLTHETDRFSKKSTKNCWDNLNPCPFIKGDRGIFLLQPRRIPEEIDDKRLNSTQVYYLN